jgi:hypothetical protein
LKHSLSPYRRLLLGGFILVLPWCTGCSANVQHVLYQGAFAGSRIITDLWLTNLANALIERP